jgi:hypothetical protein
MTSLVDPVGHGMRPRLPSIEILCPSRRTGCDRRDVVAQLFRAMREVIARTLKSVAKVSSV